ncbi:hypothetical protein F441_18264 [Phytophthora nicotianae CJ01A1]|uniref:Chromo domain-containing protein n=4 Tax=Phytophthora nicotianae TaxID=4792 RepID=W2PKZ2_PHYN3|nr:hypothetical protein PPTG_17001 [Phytophthora nicotianae INRA-310]ETN01532.1 hypothetical protein PPTG_17001 [Phytophthora nicotianae INRA-310]ETP05043.1 hypothetical protein F441_18264 [Phytophthora nicotianae CJ01A1]
MTTAHRAQVDDQTEKNLVFEDALQCMMSYHGDDLGYEGYATDKQNTTLPEYAKNLAKKCQVVVETRSKGFKRGPRTTEGNLPLKTVNENAKLKNAKLAAKKGGPFVIEHIANANVAKLILPRAMQRLKFTFNVELLSHYLTHTTKFSNHPIPKAVAIILDVETGEGLYVIVKLLARRTRRKKREWIVKWHGLSEHEAPWKGEANIKPVSHWRQLPGGFYSPPSRSQPEEEVVPALTSKLESTVT